MPYLIRDIELEDLQAITEIYAHNVRHGTASFELDPPNQAEMTARMKAITAKQFPYIVAIDEETSALLGYAYASPYRARPAYRWMVENSVYIAESAQGNGLGKALTNHLIERCAALGFRQMVAIIGGSSHMPSIKMHEALGFALIGVQPDTGFKHGRWIDTVIMQKALGDGGQTDPDQFRYPGTLYP